MGGSMARNILKAGYELKVYNRTPAKADALVAEGAKAFASPAELAKACDVILSCVSDTPDVLQVVTDARTGVLAGVRAGAIVIDCSTVAPHVAATCAKALSARGASFLDAPVSGGDVGARNATLSIMVGGDKAAFDRALCVLGAMGKTITYCGPSGAGYVAKLCNQICGGLHVIAAAEAIALAHAAGTDVRAMLQAVSSGAAGSWMLTNLAPKIIAGDDKPGFFVDYQLKDLRIAAQACRDLHLTLPGAALAEELFQAASAQGFGRCGTQAIYHVIQPSGQAGQAKR